MRDAMTAPVPDAALDDRWAIVGTSGAGKTYAARGMMERLLRADATVCWVDALGVAYGIRSSADGSGSGFPVVIFGGRHADVPITEHMGEAVGRIIADASYSTIVDLDGLGSGAARRRFMLAFLESLYEGKRRQGAATEPLHVIFDEADLWAPQRPGLDALALLGKMEEIVRRGRVAGFIPWLITQRPAVLHKDVLSQADGLIAMKLTSSQDRGALGAWIEGQADTAQAKAILADLPKLPQGTGYIWSPARGLLEKVAFPPITTFDSSRTPKRGERIAKPTTLAQVDVAGIRAALEAAAAEAEPDRKGKNPDVRKSETDRLQKEAWGDGYKTGFHDGVRHIEEVLGQTIEDIAGQAHMVWLSVKSLNDKTRAERVNSRAGENIAPPTTEPERHAPSTPPRKPVAATTASGELSSAASRMLAARRAHVGIALSWDELCILSGIITGNGYFYGGKKELVTGGYLDEACALLKPGVAPDPPLSVPDVAALWMPKLKAPGGVMLTHLMRRFPHPVAQSELASATGVKPRNGYWYGGLKALRRVGLIGDGDPVALAALLTDGRIAP